MKVLVGATDNRILGFALDRLRGRRGDGGNTTAILADLPYTKLRDAVFAHLTVAEGLGFLFESVTPRSL